MQRNSTHTGRTPGAQALLGAAATLAIVLSTPWAAPWAAEQPLDRILVVVNDDVITARELDARLQDTQRQLAAQGVKRPPEPLLRKQVLDQMITENLQLQLAERAGINVSEASIDTAMEKIAARNKMSLAEFEKTLRAEGMDMARYRAQIKEQVIIQQLVEREINNRVTVSDVEVDEFLEQRRRLLGGQDAFELSHIMVPVPESATTDQIQRARQHAEKIYGLLAEGRDFQETAVAYSSGQHALQGGNLGWRSAGELPGLFVEAIQDLQPGQLSAILRSPNGFHILRVNNRRSPTKTQTVTQTRARHILLKPDAIRSPQAVTAKLLQLKDRIEHGDDFADLARAHSQDPVSAADGGDLGWFSPGQMVPEFERAASALQPGQLSGPVQSPFGVHLIQVLERRSKDIGAEVDRSEARRLIHSRKAEERYQGWVQQLRDEAYIQHLSDMEG